MLILRNNQISDIKHVSSDDIDMDKIMKLQVLDVTSNKIRGKKIDHMFVNTVVFMWGNGHKKENDDEDPNRMLKNDPLKIR